MATDRADDAARLRRALAANPQDRVGWHNLAAAEGDLGNSAEAEAAARRALALGIPAPETRLVLARALQDLNRLEEAERMFEEALALRPTYPEAHRDLSQLRWMRTGRADAALRALDAALAKAPRDFYLHLVRSIALRATAWRLLGDARYEALYDYARLTHAETIDAPLEALKADLEALHRYRAHPFQQSVRGGGQLPLNAREMATLVPLVVLALIIGLYPESVLSFVHASVKQLPFVITSGAMGRL